MNLNPIVLSIPVFFVLIGIELIVERLSHRKLYRFPDAIANLSCGITSQFTGLFLTVLGIGAYEMTYANAALFHPAQNWLYWVALFLLVDVAYYWGHRMSHEVNLFWGGHVVHHQSEDYNLSVALRQSSVQIIWTFAFNLPIALLGFKTEHFIVISAFNTLYQFWIHTEAINKLGWFEYVFNTPSHHRVHHGRNPKYIDKNHAGTLIIWDRLFGTFQKEEERPVYGITKPINSWNAAWANLSHYVTMTHEVKQIPRWSDRIQYLFRKPGWFPAGLGGYRAAPEIDLQTYRKYDTPPSGLLVYYVLFQYVLCVSFSSLFLVMQGGLDLGYKAAIALLLSAWVIVCGVLFENKKWVVWAEWIRIPVYSFLMAIAIYAFELSPLLYIGAVTYLAASLFWYTKIYRHGLSSLR